MFIITAPHPRARQAFVALGTAALLGLSACGSSGSAAASKTKASPSKEAAGAASTTSKDAGSRLAAASQPVASGHDYGKPVDTTGLAGKVIFYVPFLSKISYFAQIEQNLKPAIESVGAKLYSCDGQGNPSGFSGCFGQAEQQHPAAVITDYISYSVASVAYERLRTAGIPVFVYGSETQPGVATSPAFAFGSPDYYQFAAVERQADAAIADSAGKAHILYLRLTDSDAVKAAGTHALDYLAKSCPGCKVTDKTTGIANISTVPSLISSALVADPTIDYVLPQADTYVAAAISGIQNAGKTRTVKLATTNASLGDLQQVASNPQLLAFVGNNPPYVAWTIADSVFRMLQGQVPPTTYPVLNRVFTSQNVTDLKLTPDAAASGEWYGSSAYRKAFTSLWGVK